MLERSFASAETVTDQPLPSSPRRFATGTFDVGEEHLGEVAIAGHVLDRPHFDAGVFMSTSRQVMPSCFTFGAKSVRTNRMIQSAHGAPVVQIFWPLTT